jgi:Tol biopolymer transport system component/predicted Ser/Thr protein kinase
MPLSAGTRLGPYEILAPISKGGMGEVYRATDTRLHREVAIKVSAERFTERFEREARAIAALNHPNICHLYDVGPNYLVMELVEGETLKGPLPLETALDYARQIADALEAAHEKGIIHRDLKPGNIKIKPDGTVKVLDFGLAKMGGTPTAPSEESPTVTMNETQAGVILGTAAYMAPEQAKGKPVDKRADIWAFGVVLYEMLTGERMFHGETTTEVLASVLKEEPKFDRVPEKVRPLLRRCLEKDPKKRLRDIGEAMAWVENAPAAATAASRSRLGWVPWAVAAAAVVALATVSWMLWPRETDRPLVRQDVDLGPDIFMTGPVRFVPSVVFSPDGTRVAFLARSSETGKLKLFTRTLDQPKAIALPGTEGGGIRGPFFSPDGKWIGFYAYNKLNKIAVEGGAVFPLAPITSEFTGASWGKDSIVFGQQQSPMQLISPAGGQATPLTEIGSSPQLLPGGKAVLYAQNTTADPDTGTVEVLTLEDHRKKTLLHGGAFPRYVASSSRASSRWGHLLYVFHGAVFALPFDLDRLETDGTAVRMLDDLAGIEGRTAGKFDVSQTGTLVYQKGAVQPRALVTVQWQDAAGLREPILASPGDYRSPRLPPDGKRLAFWGPGGTGNPNAVQVYDPQTGGTTKLATGYEPLFSSDGLFVVFEASGDGTNHSLGWARTDGAGQPQPLLAPGQNEEVPFSFSSDGKLLAYVVLGGPGSSSLSDYSIFTVPVEELNGQLKAGTPEQFLKGQVAGVSPAFSLDGKWLAYSSASESGTRNVFVRPFHQPDSGPGRKWMISVRGGAGPVWSGTSPDLLYVGPDGLMPVHYTVNGDVFVPDKPRLWAQQVPKGSGFLGLSPDGKRMALMTRSDQPPEPCGNTRSSSSKISSMSCAAKCPLASNVCC